MSNNFIAPVPVPPEDDGTAEGVVEVDGATHLDPDADADQVDSAEADRIASTE